MSKVYIVQNQMRFDRNKGVLVERFPDMKTHAAPYGEVIYLLSPSAGPWNTESVIGDLCRNLSTYGDNDYLLLIGNPALIGFAVAVAAANNEGRVNLLQWNGKDQSYNAIRAELPKRQQKELITGHKVA